MGDCFLGRIGKVTPKQDMSRFRKLEQRLERDGIRRNGRIKVELPGLLDDLLPTASDVIRHAGQHSRGPVDEVGQCAACMREDDLAAWILAENTADNQVHGASARFMGIVEHGLRHVAVYQPRVLGMGGMHKYNGLAVTEFGPDRPEMFMAEIVMALAVSGEQRDAVCMEDIHRVADLLHSQLRIEQRRDGGEEAIFPRFLHLG